MQGLHLNLGNMFLFGYCWWIMTQSRGFLCRTLIQAWWWSTMRPKAAPRRPPQPGLTSTSLYSPHWGRWRSRTTSRKVACPSPPARSTSASAAVNSPRVKSAAPTGQLTPLPAPFLQPWPTVRNIFATLIKLINIERSDRFIEWSMPRGNQKGNPLLFPVAFASHPFFVLRTKAFHRKIIL